MHVPVSRDRSGRGVVVKVSGVASSRSNYMFFLASVLQLSGVRRVTFALLLASAFDMWY